MENLGHQIDAEGLHATPSKSIQDAQPPRNEQKLPSFLGLVGLVNYYGKFIPKLFACCIPSTSCCASTHLGDGVRLAYSVLAHYSRELPVKLAADTSGFTAAGTRRG